MAKGKKMNKDNLYIALYEFKNLKMKNQGDFTNKLFEILDRVSEGVWNQHDGGFYSYSQCSFCCVSPQSKHDDDCPVILARQLKDEYLS